MIAKLPSKRRDRRSSFKDLINYCLGVTGHAKNSVLHVGTRNLNSPPEKAYLEMEGLSYENVRCKNPVLHFILSWRAEESPTNEQVDEAVEIALKELDLQGCQALWALQSDTENLHVHVAVNRVSPENFKAIRPAGGWTKKALERAARKIEIRQGWDVERTGRYEVDEVGNVFERDAKARKTPEISQKARDIEAHTGIESLERQAKRELATILETAASWDELHVQLASKGFLFERKGNGAVLKKGDRAVKLSQVSRESSFKKLEARLGDYQERKRDVKTQTPVKPNQDEIQLSPQPAGRKSMWEEYRAEREIYIMSKSRAIGELKARQKQERENLYFVQKSRRTEIFSESWKGRGGELNQIRSIIAFASQRERLALREHQSEEILELKSHYLKRFPSFKDWLADQSREDAYRVYRYPGQFLLSPEQSGIRIPQTQPVI